MRYCIVVPDGAADTPRPELAGRTPLEAAELPALRRLAGEGLVVSARTIPPALPAGSDVANLSLLGYDPETVYTGRAPLEAAALGLSLAEGEVAFRANTVTIRDGVMEDYAAGHIDSEESRPLIAELQASLDLPGVRLHPGVQYRHICIVEDAAGQQGQTTPPHDILGQPIEPFQPSGPLADRLQRIMERSREILAASEINRHRAARGEKPVTQLWLWGGGVMPRLPDFRTLRGLDGALITAVDLLKGIAALSGLEVLEVPGATGYYDTNYAGKGEAAVAGLREHDFVLVHVEAPDEAGHNADTAEKVAALEAIDRHILAPLLQEARRSGDLRLLVAPDHPTPIAERTHTRDAVPVCLWGPDVPAGGGADMTEDLARATGVCVPGWRLVELLCAPDPAPLIERYRA